MTGFVSQGRRGAAHLTVVLALVVLAATGPLAHAPAPALAANFATGDILAVTTDSLNLRASPGLGGQVLDVMATGRVMKVIGGPTDADGYTWYQVLAYNVPNQGQVQGWVADVFVSVVVQPATVAGGGGATVDTDVLNVRTGPGLTYQTIKTLPQGTGLLIGLPPVAADGYSWYPISLPDAPCPGWVAGEFLAFENGSFNVGAKVVVNTDVLNLRSGAGLSASVIATLPYGTKLTVTGGPIVAEGYTWYPVKTADGTVGWAAGEFLTLDTGGAAFTIGQAVVVNTDALNLRTAAGTSAAVIMVLPHGQSLTVTGGPTSADGYTWYQVETPKVDGMIGWVTGWVAGEFLAPA